MNKIYCRVNHQNMRTYSGRTQQVKIGSVVSEPGLITHGVPQGSILGPALFNIYLNDLPTISSFGDLESYVDDSKLYLSFPIKSVSEVMWNVLTKTCQKLQHGAVTIVY